MDNLTIGFIGCIVGIFLIGVVVGIQIGLMLSSSAHAIDFQTLVHFPHNCKIGVLPDKKCTTGQTDPLISENNIHQTVCNPAYLATVRSPDYKSQIFRSYNVTGNYTIDHLIPIIDGGSPYSVKNMWPQSIKNAHYKDGLEILVHNNLCNGKITLSTAEHLFSNWVSVWKKNHMPRTNQTID